MDEPFKDFVVRFYSDWIGTAAKASKSNTLPGQEQVFFALLQKAPSCMELLSLYTKGDFAKH